MLRFTTIKKGIGTAKQRNLSYNEYEKLYELRGDLMELEQEY